jgi:cell division protein FtsB
MDKHNLVIVILLVLFLGSLGFSVITMTQGSEVEAKVEDKGPDYSSELEKLSAKVTELEAEKKKIEEQKTALGKQLKYELKNKPKLEVEKDSPFDHVKDKQVKVLKTKVEINVKNVKWWTIQDTNSMDPLIDIGTTALSIEPESEDSIHLGDVAFYHSNIVNGPIVHRIIDISFDDKGWFSKFKGDNLEYPDPENVRFEQVLGILIGIIY